MKNNLKFYLLVIKLFIKGNSVLYIRNVIKENEYKKMMLEFRTNALFFGFDVNNYTDEEIIEMINNAGKEILKFGVSVDEAGAAFGKLSKSLI